MTDIRHVGIRTHIVYPPIPIRNFDWAAYFEDDEPTDNGYMHQGFGSTEQEAIDDLLESYES